MRMTEAIVGARDGLDGLPEDWVQGLLDRYRFERLAERILARIGG